MTGASQWWKWFDPPIAAGTPTKPISTEPRASTQSGTVIDGGDSCR